MASFGTGYGDPSYRTGSKDAAKLTEFSGNRGFPTPDDAENWLRSVARAVRINRWTVEEAFEHVQSKLTTYAATWNQNREGQFDQNPRGAAEGWRTF